GGAGGGASADSPKPTDDAAPSGDGRPTVLGHRLLAESGEPNEAADSNETASNGSNGSNTSNDSNGSNGGSNDQNGSTESGSTPGGSGNGGDQGGAPEGGVNSLAVSLADESPTTTGGEVHDVPEPGSILLVIGAAAALARRSTSAKASADKRAR